MIPGENTEPLERKKCTIKGKYECDYENNLLLKTTIIKIS